VEIVWYWNTSQQPQNRILTGVGPRCRPC